MDFLVRENVFVWWKNSGESFVFLRFSNGENGFLWVRACGWRMLGVWALAEFLSCVVLWFSWFCLVRVVVCSLSGKKVCYLCSSTLFARI